MVDLLMWAFSGLVVTVLISTCMSFLFVLEFTLTPHFFREFNLLMRIYLNAATGAEGDQLLRGVLSSVSLTDS